MSNRAVALIPARGGSKRISNKNIKEFYGKPIIAYSIETAFESNIFDEVYVSTDSPKIASIAKEYGAKIIDRPAKLADDYATTQDVIKHALDYLKDRDYEFLATIYATAPFLKSKYLKEAFNQLKNSNAINAFGVTSMPFPIQRSFKIKDNRCEMFFPEYYNSRSQDLEEAYQDAGAFYFTKIKEKSNDIFFGRDTIPIKLPRYLVHDIDTIEDWKMAEIMFEVINKEGLKNDKK